VGAAGAPVLSASLRSRSSRAAAEARGPRPASNVALASSREASCRAHPQRRPSAWRNPPRATSQRGGHRGGQNAPVITAGTPRTAFRVALQAPRRQHRQADGDAGKLPQTLSPRCHAAPLRKRRGPPCRCPRASPNTSAYQKLLRLHGLETKRLRLPRLLPRLLLQLKGHGH